MQQKISKENFPAPTIIPDPTFIVFFKIFPPLCLFQTLRLFQTLEYIQFVSTNMISLPYKPCVGEVTYLEQNCHKNLASLINHKYIFSRVFRKQVGCNTFVWKSHFIQFCFQRLCDCYYLDILLQINM